MKFSIQICTLVLGLTLGGTVLAQDTTTSNEFPVGTLPEVLVGQSYVAGVNGDWEVVCIKAAEGKETCRIYQAIKDTDGNPVAEINLFMLPPGGVAIAGAQVTTPLLSDLTAQVVFAIEGGAPKQYAYNWCESVGCVSQIGFTGPELDALKSGSTATLTIRSVSNPGAPITLVISLKGFTAALEATQ